MRALLISPHLDDAVLSAGRFLAGNPGSAVVTLFAGIPKDAKYLGEYDKKMGFPSSQIGMRIRRAEDDAALEILGAKAFHLNYLEAAYAQTESTYAIALQDLIELAKEFDAVLGPLGIRHPDHLKTREIVNVLSAWVELPFYLWADLPYRVTDPGSAWERAGKLQSATLDQGDKLLKLKACKAYESQWGEDDITPKNVLVAEEFWRLK